MAKAAETRIKELEEAVRRLMPYLQDRFGNCVGDKEFDRVYADEAAAKEALDDAEKP
jgi:hypothetical protein